MLQNLENLKLPILELKQKIEDELKKQDEEKNPKDRPDEES